jgi:metal-sulfur cluster biosynthetic enzyme
VTFTGEPPTVVLNAVAGPRLPAGKITTCSLVAALSAEGRTNLTVAQVGVTADTATRAGAVNVDVSAAVRDIDSAVDGVEAALRLTASTRGAATTTGAVATQSFFIP